MGRVREWHFEAVIGIGGIGQEPASRGIDRKIMWIGIGPVEVDVDDNDNRILAFEHFYLRDEKGRLLRDIAPRLAKRLFKQFGPRTLLVDANDEVESILKLARNAPASPALVKYAVQSTRYKCSPKTKRC